MEVNLLPKFNEEINTVLGSDYWKTLLEQNDNTTTQVKSIVSKHVINVLQ